MMAEEEGHQEQDDAFGNIQATATLRMRRRGWIVNAEATKCVRLLLREEQSSRASTPFGALWRREVHYIEARFTLWDAPYPHDSLAKNKGFGGIVKIPLRVVDQEQGSALVLGSEFEGRAPTLEELTSYPLFGLVRISQKPEGDFRHYQIETDQPYNLIFDDSVLDLRSFGWGSAPVSGDSSSSAIADDQPGQTGIALSQVGKSSGSRGDSSRGKGRKGSSQGDN